MWGMKFIVSKYKNFPLRCEDSVPFFHRQMKCVILLLKNDYNNSSKLTKSCKFLNHIIFAHQQIKKWVLIYNHVECVWMLKSMSWVFFVFFCNVSNHTSGAFVSFSIFSTSDSLLRIKHTKESSYHIQKVTCFHVGEESHVCVVSLFKMRSEFFCF